ncbi:MAG: hypothetical protein IPG94_04960 [Kineosporiaceae bacterium]|nr:hypothetical protein [Kineosporiaceae bacterium]
MILIIANIGTAVALYGAPAAVQGPGLSGHVTARVMESVFIAVGVLSVVTIVSVRRDFAGSVAQRAPPSPPSVTRSSPCRSGRLRWVPASSSASATGSSWAT